MTNKPRAWYQKKRYIAGGFLFIVLALASIGSDPSSPVTEIPVQVTQQEITPVTQIHPITPTTSPKSTPISSFNLSNDNYYTNVNGNSVHSPAYSNGGVPSGASAECRDGTYSFSQNRSGTCSRHGGVAEWL